MNKGADKIIMSDPISTWTLWEVPTDPSENYQKRVLFKGDKTQVLEYYKKCQEGELDYVGDGLAVTNEYGTIQYACSR